MSLAKLGVPFSERGGPVRGASIFFLGRYPAFVFGGGSQLGACSRSSFHEATPDVLDPAFAYLAENDIEPSGPAN